MTIIHIGEYMLYFPQKMYMYLSVVCEVLTELKMIDLNLVKYRLLRD